jgi:hypothetical protein
LNEAAADHAEGFAATVTELQKRDSSDVIKILFWAVALVCCLLAVVVALLVWYYRPTFELVRSHVPDPAKTRPAES